MRFLKYTQKIEKNIEPLQNDWFNKLKSEINSEDILEIIAKSTNRGKLKERATIISLIVKGNKKELNLAFLKIMLAIELMQNGFMLRDDILDEQERYTGKNLMTKSFQRKTAGLAVNILLSETRKMFLGGIRELNLPQEKILKVLALLEKTIYWDALGQWLDVESEKNPYQKNLVKRYSKMLSYTPAGQYKNIAAIAYIISGGDNKESFKNIQEWGFNFGFAGQLRDDVIDIIGNEKVVGKKLGTDVLRRKKRLPLVKFLENNPQDQKYFNPKKYPDFSEKQAEESLAKMRKDKCVPDCIKITRDLVKKSLDYLEKVDLNQKEKDLLIEITELLASFK